MFGKRGTRKRFYDVGLEDIRYRGPISPFALYVFGWLCVVLSQVNFLVVLAERLGLNDPALSELGAVAGSFSVLALPCFLLYDYAVLINDNDYRKHLTVNGLATAGIILGSLLLYHRYVVQTVAVYTGGTREAIALLDREFFAHHPDGFVAFNLFIDIFLCTLFIFFLNYRPRTYFQGNKLKLFRAFSLLPILYEIASICIKYAAANGMQLSLYAMPFLTVKPPMMFAAFIAFGLWLKRRERVFLKRGRTAEEYQLFLKTNRNSWQFARFAAITMALFGFIDLMIFLFLSVVTTVTHLPVDAASGSALASEAVQTIDEKQLQDLVNTVASNMRSVGFGRSQSLLLLAPFILLFSYTRTSWLQETLKRIGFPIPLPIVAAVLVLIVYLEALAYVARNAPEIIPAFASSMLPPELLELLG